MTSGTSIGRLAGVGAFEHPLPADDIDRLGSDARGKVVVSGSHGGVYPVWRALSGGCRAAILHDAGIGMDRAGTAGLHWAEQFRFPVAAIGHETAPIGQANTMLVSGRVSHVNRAAAVLGVMVDMTCAEASWRLAAASPALPAPTAVHPARRILALSGADRRLVLVDSVSVMHPDDKGQVVVTGSHGAFSGTGTGSAPDMQAAFVLFNDAGGRATSILPVLDRSGVAAATVASSSARIGDAFSTWRDGVLSACNTTMTRLGFSAGTPARKAVATSLMNATVGERP